MLYHKARDPYYVKDFLGHKELRNTEIYINTERTIFELTNARAKRRVYATIREDLVKWMDEEVKKLREFISYHLTCLVKLCIDTK